MSENHRFGMSVSKFYGLVHLVDSRIIENDGHGMTLNTEKTQVKDMKKALHTQVGLGTFGSAMTGTQQ
jgi:hypothetical protein